MPVRPSRCVKRTDTPPPAGCDASAHDHAAASDSDCGATSTLSPGSVASTCRRLNAGLFPSSRVTLRK